jgi:hypothetical protein
VTEKTIKQLRELFAVHPEWFVRVADGELAVTDLEGNVTWWHYIGPSE